MYGNTPQNHGQLSGTDRMAFTQHMSNQQAVGATFDCETAALLRAVMLPLFETSTSWAALIDRLSRRGYRLGFRQGRLCVLNTTDGARICGLRFLGLTLRDLVARLGRPFVVAHLGGDAAGDILRAPPDRAICH